MADFIARWLYISRNSAQDPVEVIRYADGPVVF